VHYVDRDVEVRIRYQNMEKLIIEENIEDKPMKSMEIRPSFSYEHEDPKDEET